MTFGWIQGLGGAPSPATSQTLTFSSSVTAGSCLVVGFRYGNSWPGTVPTVSDNVNTGNYTLLVGFTFGTSGNSLAMWYFPNTKSGTPTVTITGLDGTSSANWGIGEYGQVATSTPVDNSNSKNVSTGTTSLSLPSVTTSNANDVLIGLYCLQDVAAQTWTDNVSGSTPSNWTNRIKEYGTENIVWWNDTTVTSTGTYFENATITTSVSYGAIQMALKQAGPSLSSAQLLMM